MEFPNVEVPVVPTSGDEHLTAQINALQAKVADQDKRILDLEELTARLELSVKACNDLLEKVHNNCNTTKDAKSEKSDDESESETDVDVRTPLPKIPVKTQTKPKQWPCSSGRPYSRSHATTDSQPSYNSGHATADSQPSYNSRHAATDSPLGYDPDHVLFCIFKGNPDPTKEEPLPVEVPTIGGKNIWVFPGEDLELPSGKPLPSLEEILKKLPNRLKLKWVNNLIMEGRNGSLLRHIYACDQLKDLIEGHSKAGWGIWTWAKCWVKQLKNLCKNPETIHVRQEAEITLILQYLNSDKVRNIIYHKYWD